MPSSVMRRSVAWTARRVEQFRDPGALKPRPDRASHNEGDAVFGFKKKDHVGEFVTGPAGAQVLQSMRALTHHFVELDGWSGVAQSIPEIGYLAAFNAWITVRDDRSHFRLTTRDSIEVGYGLVQGLCGRYGATKSLSPDDVKKLIKAGGDRLLEYDTMWSSGMKENDLGTFCFHAFMCVQARPEKTQDGFFDHASTFGEVISRSAQSLRASV